MARTAAKATDHARQALHKKYRGRIEVNPALSRSLVSYQSNRNRPYYRWFKYKEGFSAALVEFLLERFGGEPGILFDPFAGSGATLLAGRELGWTGHGIELLPVGITALKARLSADHVSRKKFRAVVADVDAGLWRVEADPVLAMQHLPITKGAFSQSTERDIASFRTFVRDQISDSTLRTVLDFACFAVLEIVSFTRKDGQYLRWDERAPRELRGKSFNKGEIPTFESAIRRQLHAMLEDLCGRDLYDHTFVEPAGEIEVRQGSCLDVLPKLPTASVDCIITSPPYCNRYDYTRTYALELAYLGIQQAELKHLRQELLTCTVENQSKRARLEKQYTQTENAPLFDDAVSAFQSLAALHEVLELLDSKAEDGLLNNSNVPRMVRNYFFESAIVIHELGRLVRPGGYVVMINDNVQYAGEEVPVDLILSEFAESAGFTTKHIWTLGRGKGNSSQQMGTHGRNELRKCAYVWHRD